MTTSRPPRRAGFTLVEMIVVITVIMLVFGSMMSGLTLLQKQSDTYSTPAIIQAVHESCFRNARQYGSAGLVYGFTLDYGSTDHGHPTANAIIPWVVVGSTVTYHTSSNDLLTDIGRQSLWDTVSSPARITFDDNLRPSTEFSLSQWSSLSQYAALYDSSTLLAKANGTSGIDPGGRYVHCGYSPRTGIMVAVDSDNSDPTVLPTTGCYNYYLGPPITTVPLLTASGITDTRRDTLYNDYVYRIPLSSLLLRLRDIKTQAFAGSILIFRSGEIDAHAPIFTATSF